MSLVIKAHAQIAVADPRRPLLGRGVALTLLAAIFFVGFTVGVKDIKFLSAAAPWGEDPYDAFFSFAIFFVGIVALICTVRVLLCRTSEPLPIVRIIDLIRGCRVILGSIFVTLAAGWISVALGSSALASPTVDFLAAGLAIDTLIALVAAVALWVSTRGLDYSMASASSSQDWLTDAVDLGMRIGDRLGMGGALGPRPVRALDQTLVAAIRRHRLIAALVVALSFGAFAGLGASIEQDPPVLVLLIVAIGTGAMLAFLAIVGTYLGLARTASTSRRPTAIIRAAIAAASSLPVAVAFRDGLWWIVGSNAADARLEQLAALLAAVAAATFALTLLVELALRRMASK
jgi:hypothetical protein